MNRPAGYKVPPHVHNKVHREVFYTQEVLFIRKGKVKVDFYDENQNYLESRILYTGDVILLASGGGSAGVYDGSGGSGGAGGWGDFRQRSPGTN